MNCRSIRERLAAYQDGEIGGEERARIAAHLGECPSCRSFYAELEQVWEAMEKIPEIEASPGFERRLAERINAVPEPRSRWRFPWVSWIDRVYPAPAMAASKKIMTPGQQKRFIELLRANSNNGRVHSPFPKN
jgi:anti-sigma factor RsiW